MHAPKLDTLTISGPRRYSLVGYTIISDTDVNGTRKLIVERAESTKPTSTPKRARRTNVAPAPEPAVTNA